MSNRPKPEPTTLAPAPDAARDSESTTDPMQAVRELQAAAKLLGDLAGRATPGPWVRQTNEDNGAAAALYRIVAGIDTAAAHAGDVVAEFPRNTPRRAANCQVALTMNPDVVRMFSTLLAGFANMRAAGIRAGAAAADQVGCDKAEPPLYPVEVKAHAIAVTLLNAAQSATDAEEAATR